MMSLWELRQRARAYLYAGRVVAGVRLLPEILRDPVRAEIAATHARMVEEYELERFRSIMRMHEARLGRELLEHGVDGVAAFDDRDLTDFL